MGDERRIRLLIAGEPGEGGGARVLAHAFRNAGMEVICVDVGERPEVLVNVAIQEDVAAIGVALAAARLELFPRITELLGARGAGDIPLFAAGGIPADSRSRLQASGVAAIFSGASPDGVRRLVRCARRRPIPGLAERSDAPEVA